MLDDDPVFPSPADVAARFAALPATPFLAYFKGLGLSVVVAAQIETDPEDGQTWVGVTLVTFDRQYRREEWSPYAHQNAPYTPAGPDFRRVNETATFRGIVREWNEGKYPPLD